jgi:[histone H3]-dimethyl-L-lysine9 demethylase
MAEEENNEIVTYRVKIKVTLTVPDPEEPIPDDETLPTLNVGATETASLNNGEGSVEAGDVAAAETEESVPDREKQAMNGGPAETASLNNGENSVEAGDVAAAVAEESVPDREKQAMNLGANTVESLLTDDEMAARDSSSVKAAVEIMKRGRKSFAEIQKRKMDEEALLVSRIKEERDVVAGGSSSFQPERKKRGRKRKAEKESTENEVPQVHKKLNTKLSSEESLACHQCKRSDKGRVIRCTKCKRRRYCIPCLNKW